MISPEELKIATNQAANTEKNSQADPCVLLAEDDPNLRRYLEIVIQRAGYEVVAAADGLEAMKLLFSKTVDVIVTDALMPNLSGYELSRFVRSSPQLSALPIVLLSALDPKNADAEHVDAFITKPVAPDELLACLSKLRKAD